ncbi:MAG: TlpA family protein disulfide reductase [Kangiellaceae bacterium]|nr:TlpA family protein disulfide reductase [Kangiellaceae bacterium]
MKLSTKYLLFPLVAIIWLLSSCSDKPDFYLIDNTPHRLEEYQGKWLIINFWAEWCAPCREEVVELNQFVGNEKFADLLILGISYDPLSRSDIKRISQQWQMKYSVIASDPNPVLPFKLPKSLPGNYIINPKGELVLTLSGKQTFDSISKLLKTLKNKDTKTE